MNNAVSRFAYRLLLRLHPAPFQHEFGAEMLWIFDEEFQRGASSYLLFDGVLSLLRQRCRMPRKSGVLSRHRHPQPVHGFVLKGSWHYLEHDWTATEGSYVYETPGETHTLVVEDDVPEMITLFQVNGAMIYVDPDGKVQGYEDVFTKIDLCRKHFSSVGLGESYVDQFLR